METGLPQSAPAEESAQTPDDNAKLSSVRPVYTGNALEAPSSGSDDQKPSSRRFLAAYITSILSALSLLTSGTVLGYALLDHFLAPESTSPWMSYFDLAPAYLALITSMLIFGALYLITSQYVARQVVRDMVGVRDWRSYRVVYAGFTAVLLTLAASIVGSLLYIPLAFALVVQDYAAHEVWIQVLGGIHALVWIGVLIWQERLVKRGKKVIFQGAVTLALVALVVVLSSIFLVGATTDERYDKRASADLTQIKSEIDTYKSKNRGELPASLDKLNFESKPLVEKRLGNYKYTVVQASEPEGSGGGTQSLQQYMLDDDMSTVGEVGGMDDFSWSFGTEPEEVRASYELCATFRTATTQDSVSPLDSLLGMGDSQTSFYQHDKGEVCFERN